MASDFIVWLLGVLVQHAPFTAAGATTAVASVPGPVTGVVGLVITVGGSFAGGYLAKHTPRPPRPEVALRARVEPKEQLPTSRTPSTCSRRRRGP